MSISIHPSTHVGTLLLSGDITEDVALEFGAGLELLCDYYQYEQITLEINSAGGQVVALEHMLASLDRWRGIGRRVSTKASFRAGSAAAMLLAMGDIGNRSALGSTNLHFHSARISGANAMITADAATNLGAVLQGTDLLHLSRLLGHQVRGFGGWHSMAAEGAARCSHLAKSERQASTSASQPPVDQFSPRHVGTVAKSFAECLARQSIDPYRRLLSRRVAEDRPMRAVEAWALCLVDSILDRPDLHPSRDHIKPNEPAVSHALSGTPSRGLAVLGAGHFST